MNTTDQPLGSDEKKSYTTPTVEAQGRVEDLTHWIGGRWGEFFNGQARGWNPWSRPSGGS